ncbi:hypothetical protein K8S17_06920 [bacterium]|nr:hypothetical protein [bacterium]
MAQAEADVSRSVVARDGVSVHYRSQDRRLAEHVLDLAITERSVVSARVGGAGLDTVAIDIAGSFEEFVELTYGGVPDWGIGCAVASERRIVLRAPRGKNMSMDMRTVLLHELGHLAVYEVLGPGRVPRWFHEGVASAVSGEWRLGESTAMALAAWRGSLLPLASLESGFPSSSARARLAYAESFQAVLLLQELAGADDVGALVESLAVRGTFDRGLRELTGMNSSAFSEYALLRFRDRFGLALVFRRGNVLFLVAAVGVIIAFLIRRRRSRNRLAEWARDESREMRRGSGRGGGSWR